MSSLIHISLVLFIFIVVTVPRANALLRGYLTLISNVHEHYGTSSVCFVTPHKNRHSHGFTLAGALTREFSRKGIMTLTINSDEMLKRRNAYEIHGIRSLIVVLLTNIEDVENFRDNTRDLNISFPIWLLLFTNVYGPRICEYCNGRPMRNIFRLRFNTEMLVSCCDDPVLKEWWSIRDNETEMTKFGRWTVNDGLTLFMNQSLYARRHEINGTGFRVAFIKSPTIQEGQDVGGLFGALLTELKLVMNFEITSILVVEDFGSWDTVKQSWSGVMEQIRKGKADLGVAEFSITNHRRTVVDFTLPLMVSRMQLYLKELDDTAVQWSAHFKVFTLKVWLTIVLLVITSTILVALMKMRTRVNSFSHILFEQYLHVWGIFCQQGLAVFPVETPLRIAYCSIFVSALVVSAAYSASLISFITVSSDRLPFSTVEGFVNDGSYRLITVQNSADWDFVTQTTSDPVTTKMKTLIKPWNDLPRSIEEACKQVCTERVALFTSEAMVKTRKAYFPCKIAQIDTGSVDNLAMIMPAESQYTGLVNYHIQRFRDNGMMNRLKQIYLTETYELETTPNQVSLVGIAPILSVLAGGIALASVVLLCEKLYHPFWRFDRKCRKPNDLKRLHSRRKKLQGCFDDREKQRALNLSSRFRWQTEYFGNLPMPYYP